MGAPKLGSHTAEVVALCWAFVYMLSITSHVDWSGEPSFEVGYDNMAAAGVPNKTLTPASDLNNIVAGLAYAAAKLTHKHGRISEP